MADKRTVAGAVAALCTALSACGDGGVYIMSEQYELIGDDRIPAGGGCTLAIPTHRSTGTVDVEGGTLENDFHYAQTRVGSSYLVVISSRGTELARREYSRDQLLSGERDQ